MLPSKADFRSYRWNIVRKYHKKKLQKKKLEVKNAVQGEICTNSICCLE